MRYGVVEGEPGIFPDPVARVLRAFGRLMRGEKRDTPSEPPDDQPKPAPDET